MSPMNPDELKSPPLVVNIGSNWDLRVGAGESGDLELEQSMLMRFLLRFQMFCTKQHDYGPGNIALAGEMGVAIRMQDKIQRLLTPGVKANESRRDSWMDLGNYADIGLLVLDKKWPQETPERMQILGEIARLEKALALLDGRER